jgi:hypothetical protein
LDVISGERAIITFGARVLAVAHVFFDGSHARSTEMRYEIPANCRSSAKQLGTFIAK